jgi:predicted nucleotidyltransferase component of viral defense system
MRGQPEAKLKIEVNCNERVPVHEIIGLDYEPPRLASGIDRVTLRTYDVNEMLGTKMLALYQRDQGRDLFDLWWALTWVDGTGAHVTDPDLIVAVFDDYMRRENGAVSADDYEGALDRKAADPNFTSDVGPLLRDGLQPRFEVGEAAETVRDSLIAAMRRREANPGP